MDNNHSLSYQRGLSLFNKLHGGQAGEQLVNNLKSVCPDFVNMTIEWATEGIMARPGLDLLTREYLRHRILHHSWLCRSTVEGAH